MCRARALHTIFTLALVVGRTETQVYVLISRKAHIYILVVLCFYICARIDVEFTCCLLIHSVCVCECFVCVCMSCDQLAIVRKAKAAAVVNVTSLLLRRTVINRI